MELLLFIAFLLTLFGVMVGGTLIGFGFLISSLWIYWLYSKGSNYLLHRIEKNINFPTLTDKHNYWSYALTILIFGLIIYTSRLYLVTGPILTELFIIISIISIFQISLPLMLLFYFKNFSLFMGFLSSSIILHALALKKPEIFYNINGTSLFPHSNPSEHSIIFVKIVVLLYFMIAIWFLSRSIFIIPNNETNYNTIQSKQTSLRSILRKRGDYVRYISYIIGGIVAFIQFFNIIYDLYITK